VKSVARLALRLVYVFAFVVMEWGGASVTLSSSAENGSFSTGEVEGAFLLRKFQCVRAVENKVSDRRCLQCHPGVLAREDVLSRQENESGPIVIGVHAQHMYSAKANFTCTICHQSIDPYQSSSEGLMVQVSPRMCVRCHFPHGVERKVSSTPW